MNKRQKAFLQFTIEEEKLILADLKKIYEQAAKDIDLKIAALLARKDAENLQSIIYQVDYQRALKQQIGAILDELNTKQFESISKYLTECYENGFLGVLYDLQGQGIPLIFPINQEEVVRAIVHDTKLSKRLYTSLGEDVGELKKRIRAELSRGISQAYTYEKIAKNIRNQTSIGFNKSMRIVRTEGHRITQEATFDAQHKAKDAGADIVKQWDSTLDGRTRELHSELDGQIRELDEPFTVGAYRGQYPSGFGAPEMDINCRCVLLQRARSVLGGKGNYTKFDGNKGRLVDLSDVDNFSAFKQRVKRITAKDKGQA
jgi:SPP1 gp7 family putative phage head morphogenesis protein